jgi:uncharacterized membrane-anchored protein YhcB (DUF1043 family)
VSMLAIPHTSIGGLLVTEQQQPDGSTSAETSPKPKKRAWYRRTWVVAVATLVVGFVIGVSASDPTTSPEYQDVAAELAQTEEQLETAEESLAATEEELEALAGDLPAREEQLEVAEADLAEREEKLDKLAATVEKRAKQVTRREKAVGLVEKEIANNTIPGDGVFEVGADMKPGMYKTPGSADCYYAVLADANGNNIISNNITSGPATVTVSAGQFLEVTRCADWVLQR